MRQWCILLLQCWCNDISTFWDLKKCFNGLFLLHAPTFGKVFHFKNASMFHFHGFQPVSSSCLHVAMLQWYCYCRSSARGLYPNISAELLKIKLWCLNSNTKHKGEIQCPPPHLTICSKCARRPSFGPCFRKFSPRVRGARGCPQWFPMTSSHSETKIHHCNEILMRYKK